MSQRSQSQLVPPLSKGGSATPSMAGSLKLSNLRGVHRGEDFISDGISAITSRKPATNKPRADTYLNTEDSENVDATLRRMDDSDSEADEDPDEEEADDLDDSTLMEYQEGVDLASRLTKGQYVLFLDPESFLYYRKDLHRNDFFAFEPFADEEAKAEFFKANQIHLYKIRKLLVLDNFSWNFKGEADLYRRRPFPKRFMHPEASDYPCYVFQSELSKAFNHKGDIETIVDLIEYRYTLAAQAGAQGKFQVRFKESLVTSTKEFIKNILRKVYERYKVKIIPSRKNNLILKADGYREYFEGNYQLLQYERVRTCLRRNEPMKLILTEIPRVYRDRRFPPIFKSRVEVPCVDAEGSGPADPGNFNFKLMKGSSPYFWYPPVPNVKTLYDRMEKAQKLKTATVNTS